MLLKAPWALNSGAFAAESAGGSAGFVSDCWAAALEDSFRCIGPGFASSLNPLSGSVKAKHAAAAVTQRQIGIRVAMLELIMPGLLNKKEAGKSPRLHL
jgi:hypothetical protein